MKQARLINECLHAYGIHSTTLQPELATSIKAGSGGEVQGLRQRPVKTSSCQISCGSLCEDLTCCG
jgi:zinc transporter 1